MENNIWYMIHCRFRRRRESVFCVICSLFFVCDLANNRARFARHSKSKKRRCLNEVSNMLFFLLKRRAIWRAWVNGGTPEGYALAVRMDAFGRTSFQHRRFGITCYTSLIIIEKFTFKTTFLWHTKSSGNYFGHGPLCRPSFI